MNRIRQNSINYLLLLDLIFSSFFTDHYPREIVGIIILIYWKLHPIKIGSKYQTSFVSVGSDTYIWGSVLNDISNPYLPMKLESNQIEKIAIGYNHLLVLMESGIYSCGKNTKGQLGLGDFESSKSLRKIDLNSVLEICCGQYHSMAIVTDGEIYVWGCNEYGQLGLEYSFCRSFPTKLNLKAIKISACDFNSMALTANGEVYTWGTNGSYQLGLGHNDLQNFPQKLNLNNIVEIQYGDEFSLAMESDGKIYGWGSNYFGELDSEENIYQQTPEELDLTYIVTVACGNDHVLALNTNGEVYGWGHNGEGQLGLNKTSRNELHTVNPYLTHIVQVACGSYHSMAVNIFGDVYVWGQNDEGQLGLGHCLNQPIPKKIEF